MSTGRLTARNRTNSQVSIRRRFLRSGSEDQKQITKNSTATSFRPKLERLIKQGKLQQIVYCDPHSKANLFYTTHINQMQKELAASKQSLSTIVLKSKSKEYSINKLKNDIRKVEHQSAIIKSQANVVNRNLEQKLSDLFHIKDTVQNNQWTEKSYLHLKNRLIQDQKFLKARHQTLDHQYHRSKTQYKDLETNFYELSQFSKKLNKMVEEAKKISKEQVEQKNQFVELLNKDLAEKQMLDNLKDQKKKKDESINQLAASQIEKQELSKYMQILFTHRILGKIIKTKSNKLIEQYKDLQKSYMYIKSNTNISDFGKILQRMELQDQVYENALKRVTTLENEVTKLQLQIKQSEQNRNRILSNQGERIPLPKQRYQGMAFDQYELLSSEKEKLLKKKREDQILIKRIKLWVQQQCPILNIRNQQKDFIASFTELIEKIKRNK